MQILALIIELIESLITTIISTFRQFIVTPTLGYIRWLAAFIWVPEIVDVTIYREIFTKHWKVFLTTAIAFTLIAIPWDYFEIEDGVWSFPGKILGIWFLGIPLEEYLWFISVTWAVVLVLLFFYKVKIKRDVQ